MVVMYDSSSSYGQTVFLPIQNLASGGVALFSANTDAFTIAMIIDQRVPAVPLAYAPTPVIAAAAAGKTCKTVNDLGSTSASIRYLSP